MPMLPDFGKLLEGALALIVMLTVLVVVLFALLVGALVLMVLA